MQESLSTIRYKLIEKKGLKKREDIVTEYLKKIKVDIGEERKTIYGMDEDLYLFHYINDVQFNEHNELIDTPLVRKLEKIKKAFFLTILTFYIIVCII